MNDGILLIEIISFIINKMQLTLVKGFAVLINCKRETKKRFFVQLGFEGNLITIDS